MNRLPRSIPLEANTRKGFLTCRGLLECETQDVRAAEAIALSCYQVKNISGHSAAAGRWFAVRVIQTDEECMIAKTVCRVLGLG